MPTIIVEETSATAIGHNNRANRVILFIFFLFFFLKVVTSHKSFYDVYTLPLGFRTVRVEGSRFLINNVPFYFKGFGKRQDTDVSPLFLCVNAMKQKITN